MQRDVIRLQFNEPCLVKLDKGPQGIQRENQYGIDYQYTCNDDSAVMWLPKAGREALVRSGAQAGDEVEITKAKRGRDIVFFAQKASDATEPPAPARPTPAPANGNGSSHVHRTPGRPLAANAPPVPARQPEPASQPVVRNQAASAQAVFPPVARQLAACLCAAIDAAVEAEVYAKAKGLPVEFGAEDIRAIALSAYIGAQRNGGAR